MTIQEAKAYATEHSLRAVISHIESAEEIFSAASSLSDFEKMQAQQKINQKLSLATMQIETHQSEAKKAQERKARFDAMSDVEKAQHIKSEQADTDAHGNHPPLRELTDAERKGMYETQAESNRRQHAHENEDHVSGRPY